MICSLLKGLSRNNRGLKVTVKYFLHLIMALAFCCAPAIGGTTALTDASGRNIEVKAPFKRIISLYSGHTENLFRLGSVNEVIGVSGNEDFHEPDLKKPVFDYRVDSEHILAARPDLVLIRPMIERSSPELVGKLEKAGIRVISLQPVGISELFIYWKQLGMITGRNQEAEAMTRDFKSDISRISAIVAKIPARERKRVYFESIHSKMKTFSQDSMAIFVLTSAGGVNVASDAGKVRNTNIAFYGKERILSRASEIDVFLSQKGVMNRIDSESIMNEPGFGAIKAIRQGEVYFIDEALVSRPTMRLIDGIKAIGGLLYPDFFLDPSLRRKGQG